MGDGVAKAGVCIYPSTPSHTIIYTTLDETILSPTYLSNMAVATKKGGGRQKNKNPEKAPPKVPKLGNPHVDSYKPFAAEDRKLQPHHPPTLSLHKKEDWHRPSNFHVPTLGNPYTHVFRFAKTNFCKPLKEEPQCCIARLRLHQLLSQCRGRQRNATPPCLSRFRDYTLPQTKHGNQRAPVDATVFKNKSF